MMTKATWRAVQEALEKTLTVEESRILDFLAAGKTQPEIGAILGLHRSAVWRRIRVLRIRYQMTVGRD